MELRLLRYFLAVAECGSVSDAAKALHVAQPSLSRQLRHLERELGAVMFVRGTGPLRLNAAGRQFLPIARDLVVRHDRAAATVRSFAGHGARRLTIAAPSTTVADVLAPFLAHEADPAVELVAIEESADTGYEAVLDGRADVALTIVTPPIRLASRPVAEFRLYAYVAQEHPWNVRSEVSLNELSGPPLIVTPASGSLRVLLPALEQLRLPHTIAFEVPAPKIAQALAAAGRGVAVLSDDPRFGLRPIEIRGSSGLLTVPVFASWDADHYGRDTIEQLVGELSRYCGAHWPS